MHRPGCRRVQRHLHLAIKHGDGRDQWALQISEGLATPIPIPVEGQGPQTLFEFQKHPDHIIDPRKKAIVVIPLRTKLFPTFINKNHLTKDTYTPSRIWSPEALYTGQCLSWPLPKIYLLHRQTFKSFQNFTFISQ